MKVYTSSYWKYKGSHGVQISNSMPEGAVTYRRLPMLYPRWDMVSNWNKVKKLPDTHPEKLKEWRRFEDEYWKKLCSIGVDHIISCLSEGDVLLCWCNKEEWCHRTILAKWLRLNGVEVEEI